MVINEITDETNELNVGDSMNNGKELILILYFLFVLTLIFLVMPVSIMIYYPDVNLSELIEIILN